MVERLNIWLKFLAANLLNLAIWVNLNYMIFSSTCSGAGGEEGKGDVVFHETARKSHSSWKRRWRMWFNPRPKWEVKWAWTGCPAWNSFPGVGGLHTAKQGMESPKTSLSDAAPVPSNTAVKLCQQKCLGTVCSWAWIQQEISVGWIRNLNHNLSHGSSCLGNFTPGSAISPPHHSPYYISPGFVPSKETQVDHSLWENPWRGSGVVSRLCMSRNVKQILQITTKWTGFFFIIVEYRQLWTIYFAETASFLPLAKFHNLLIASYVKTLQKKNDGNFFIMRNVRQLYWSLYINSLLLWFNLT